MITMDAPANPQEFVAQATEATQNAEQRQLDYVCEQFRLGVLLQQNQTDVTIQQLAEMLGIPRKQLLLASSLAAHFDCDESKARAAFYALEPPRTYYQLYRVLRRAKHKKTLSNRSVRTTLERLIQHIYALKHDPEQYPQLVHDLSKVRAAINRHIPQDFTEIDENFLRYSNCCCCGASEPPDVGYTLYTHKRFAYLRYPVCNTCEADGQSQNPDFERVAQLYALYAQQLEYDNAALKSLL